MIREKRKHDRLDLEDLPARIHRVEDGAEVDFCPMNVSPTGMAILCSNHLSVGAEIILSLDEQEIKMTVRWCQPKDNDPGVFRVGLETIDPSIQLDEIIKEQLTF